MTRNALLLLHGFTGSPESFSAVIAETTAAPPVVAPALLGHSADTMEGPETTFDDEIHRLARTLTPGQTYRLCGYSLGARLGLGLLLEYPAFFSGATFIGVNPGLSQPERDERLEADARWIDLIRRDGMEAFIRQWESIPLFATQQTLPPEILAIQRQQRARHRAAGMIRSLQVTGLGAMPNYWGRLQELRMPVTLMAGSLDEKFLAIARRAKPLIPRGSLRVVSGAGHNLVLEDAKAVARALAEETCQGA